MKVATILSGHLTDAANQLRIAGHLIAAEALYALTDGYDALVIEGSEPLPRQTRVGDLERAMQLTRDLAIARADLAQFTGLSVTGPFAEVIFYARVSPSTTTRRLFSFDTDRTPNTAVETVDLFEVVSKHVKNRVELLERELRALGVDPA